MKDKGDQFKLYHGSAHWFKPDDTVEPTDTLHTREPYAYASADPTTAGSMGMHRARRGEDRSNPGQTSLFAPVYEVEHNSPPTKQARRAGSYTDAAGFTVKRLAGLRSTLNQDYLELS